MSFQANNSTYNYGIDLLGDDRLQLSGGMGTRSLELVNRNTASAGFDGFTLYANPNDDVFGIATTSDEADKSGEPNIFGDELFDFEAASGGSGSSSDNNGESRESSSSPSYMPIGAAESELSISTEDSNKGPVPPAAFENYHVRVKTVEHVKISSEGPVLPSSYMSTHAPENKSNCHSEIGSEGYASPTTFISHHFRNPNLEHTEFIGTPSIQSSSTECTDVESSTSAHVNVETPVTGHFAVTDTAAGHINAEDHITNYLPAAKSAIEYFDSNHSMVGCDAVASLIAAENVALFAPVEDSIVDYANEILADDSHATPVHLYANTNQYSNVAQPLDQSSPVEYPAIAHPAVEFPVALSSPPDVDIDSLMAENACLRALIDGRSSSSVPALSPKLTKTPTKRGPRGKPKTPSKKPLPPSSSTASTSITKLSPSKTRKPSPSSTPSNALTRAGAATPKTGVSAAARAILDAPSELTSLWGGAASTLQRRNFYSLTQEEKARLLLPMLNGMDPDEIDGASGAKSIPEADKSIISQNMQAFKVEIDRGSVLSIGMPGSLEGYGAARQREALRKAEVLGVEGILR